MKLLLLTLTLSISASVMAQQTGVAKKVDCKSDDISFSFEYDHSSFFPPSAVKIKNPLSKMNKLSTDLFNSRLSVDNANNPQAIVLTAEGNTYLPRKFFGPRRDGSYSFTVTKKHEENTAKGIFSFISEEDGFQLIDHAVNCTIRNL